MVKITVGASASSYFKPMPMEQARGWRMWPNVLCVLGQACACERSSWIFLIYHLCMVIVNRGMRDACVMCEPHGSVLSVARRSDRCFGVWYWNIVGKSVSWKFLDAAPMPRRPLRLLLSTHPVAHETVAERYGPVI